MVFVLKPRTQRVVVGYLGTVKNGVLNNDVFWVSDWFVGCWRCAVFSDIPAFPFSTY